MKGVSLALAVLLVVVAVSVSCSKSVESEEKLLVAAAADLIPAFKELGASFEQATGTKVTFTFSSTGILARQIENGAPVDLFAAANIGFVDGLEKKGLITADTKALYARGRITLWIAPTNKAEISKLEDLARPEVEKVSIANPEHAPYGTAAREAFQSLGIWDRVQPKCVYGDNVRQALQYAEAGEVNAAIVALSLSVQTKGKWILIPQELHQPLDQALAVIKGAKHEKEARQFALFINGPQGRPTMRKYGFILPGEEPVSVPEN
jgi:molybdate transport system substrate-binding protein